MLVYLLIIANRGKVDHVIETIKEICIGEDLRSINVLYGEYDILAKIKAVSEEKMSEYIKKIKSIDGVQTIKVFTVATRTKESDILPK